MAAPALRVSGLTKCYPPAFAALTDVDLSIEAGEIHAVLGVNGAGKSTLIKILAGAEAPTAGSIEISGEKVAIPDPIASTRLGLGVVHQTLPLFANLSAAANAAIGMRDAAVVAPLRPKTAELAYDEIAANFVDAPSAKERLSAVSQYGWQIVAIIRALSSNARLLILDEPTSSLNAVERRSLHVLLRRLAATGVAILYVTHFLDDALDVADRVTVLRDGRNVATAAADTLTQDSLLKLMTGEDPAERAHVPQSVQTEPVLEVSQLIAAGVGPIDLTVRGGEVVGLYGLEGSGASQVLESVMGLCPSVGRIEVRGRELRASPRAMIRAGVGLVTSDRRRTLLPDWSVALNFALPRLARNLLLALPRAARARQRASEAITRFSIKAAPGQPVRELSGGNQQKLLLARWADLGGSVTMLDQPTHGVDARGRAAIHSEIDALAASGRAVLVYSTDPEETLRLCHRVLVLSDGRVVAESLSRDLDIDHLEHLTRVRSSHPPADS